MNHVPLIPSFNRPRCLMEFLVVASMTAAATLLQADVAPARDRFANHEKLVAETHAASLKLRDASLHRTVRLKATWPSGIWGDNLWCLAALYLNEKTDEANARLLKRANEFIASKPENAITTSPENPGNLPWTFFSITDYVRILCLFHAKSPHFPGRLKPETEAAMKKSLWLWVRGESRLTDADPGDLFFLLGTENHDLNRRPPYYLITALLQDDPVYRDRKLDDGHSVVEHAAAYTRFFREWPRSRAKNGLWIEIGSNTYQKYSWPALFNLHELSPDPVIRHRFGLLLDLAFIEEAQISVGGRRGGGLSRAEGGENGFANYKNLLYARDGQPAGSSHSRVIETSRYQLPPAAILLAMRAFPATKPFAIRNRVLGELKAPGQVGEGQHIASASALVNYAWRTPHYLLGSTLQNPFHEYAGISQQKRWCGLLFDKSSAATVGSIDTVIEKTGAGRPQHSFWSVQHESVLILQRIGARKDGGSYSTGKISMRFNVPGLDLIEEDGWIFASNAMAFAGVRFLDGGHRWDKTRTVASPDHFSGSADTGRILLHAGDVSTHASFARFRESVRGNPLVVTADKVDYRFGEKSQHIEMFRYDVAARDSFIPPRINGSAVNLHPAAVYQSPYLNGDSNSDRITVTVGPIRQLLKFASDNPEAATAPVIDKDKDEAAFAQAAAGAWRTVFSDPGTGDWKERWHLDGRIGKVTTSADGMVLTAGPEFGNDAHHMVLWTKDSFEGDLKIDFEVIKDDRGLFMRIVNDTKVFHAHMANRDLPAITHGRIGLRHMFTRSARYANFRVSVPEP